MANRVLALVEHPAADKGAPGRDTGGGAADPDILA
jgi:hypothetical protein